MGMRMDALWRILAFLWAYTVGGIVATIAVIIGIVWGLVDVTWQLITGRDGLSSSSRPAEIVRESIWWPIRLTVYSLTGKGEMEWLPSY